MCNLAPILHIGVILVETIAVCGHAQVNIAIAALKVATMAENLS